MSDARKRAEDKWLLTTAYVLEASPVLCYTSHGISICCRFLVPSSRGVGVGKNQVLMLVLRDVEEDGHFEALDKAARENMEMLWRGVDKPSRSISQLVR